MTHRNLPGQEVAVETKEPSFLGQQKLPELDSPIEREKTVQEFSDSIFTKKEEDETATNSEQVQNAFSEGHKADSTENELKMTNDDNYGSLRDRSDGQFSDQFDPSEGPEVRNNRETPLNQSSTAAATAVELENREKTIELLAPSDKETVKSLLPTTLSSIDSNVDILKPDDFQTTTTNDDQILPIDDENLDTQMDFSSSSSSAENVMEKVGDDGLEEDVQSLGRQDSIVKTGDVEVNDLLSDDLGDESGSSELGSDGNDGVDILDRYSDGVEGFSDDGGAALEQMDGVNEN
eukprot:CAMPEP_0115010490 /NCGR_PEP_ID=MMETSP0216-20121206/23349_1 /TAXON_ID=223996 /ORGANISM="Protocruzia adherens, Strain Boccale" /LENGTH=291 /DNA_ID=CAMNT_0002378719 /DNA_START=314 /DNA_END=1189 /DNA_ORIENTATION=+